VLLWFAKEFNAHVEPLHHNDTGGFIIKGIEGGVSLSNHASGTAMDLRWNDHPLGARGTFGALQVATIRRLLNLCGGVVRWGGDYHSRADEMHYEINAGPSRVRALADRIRAGHMPDTNPTPTPHPGSHPLYPGVAMRRGMMNNNDVRVFQAKLSSRGWHLAVDGDFGPGTEHVVRQFQAEKHLGVDGIVGPVTWAAIWTAPIT